LTRGAAAMVDAFGRRIEYVRLSVTDRCDLRCLYCMPQRMRFLPKADLLTLEELVELARRLVARGVRRIRLTGGEPLVRPGFTDLAAEIGRELGRGLDELTLTTNGMHLAAHAAALAAAGIARVNVSLDSLDPTRFRHITRGGDLPRVLAGIAAARAAGLRAKINMVALAGLNEDEIEPMLRWCAAEGLDLTLIETMPMGWVEEDRTLHYLPLDAVRQRLERRFTLIPTLARTGGPARYVTVGELGLRLGFITPLTSNFCSGCNRIRIGATGTAYACLGQEAKVELREALRSGDATALEALLDKLIAEKPRGHDFRIGGAALASPRHMSVTGG
jgi:GTP 3',8-cyclase